MNNPVIKVAVVEDLVEVALGLKEVLNEDEVFSCQQVYHNAEEAIAFLPNNAPDVILIDIGLPGMSGIEAIVLLKEQLPNTEFCMFTVFEDDEKIFKSLTAGAKGYILKNSSPENIISALKELHAGGSPMNPLIARKVINAFSQQNILTPKPVALPLTDRETQILDLLSKGLLYKEIGADLGITVGTVKQHIHKIYHKLQVNNRTEAINLYLNR